MGNTFLSETRPLTWGHTITIDGANIKYLQRPFEFSAETWQWDVWKTLKKIETTQTGKALLSLMNIPNEIPGRCRIIPIEEKAPLATAAVPVNWTNGVKRNQIFDCPSKQSNCPGRAVPHRNAPTDRGFSPDDRLRRGTGRGSDVYVRYNPDTWSGFDKQIGLDDKRDKMRADDVLLHELVHAYRVMVGRLDRVRSPREHRYDFYEEYYAITIANMYVSEFTDRPGALRADHSAKHNTISPLFDGEDGHYQIRKKYVERMCESFPESFIFHLSQLDKPTFNPFRARLKDLTSTNPWTAP